MQKNSRWIRWLPLVLLLIAIAVVYSMGWYKYLSFSTLTRYHHHLITYTQAHFFQAVGIFLLFYFLVVILAIPGPFILTMTAGYIFGIFLGSCLVLISATLGACVLFLIVKTSLGDWLKTKATGWVKRMEDGLRRNAFSYLLFVRLVPLFPFWAVNIVAAMLAVPFVPYFFATLLGIIPGVIVYAALGAGLGSVFAAGKQPDASIIFQPEILIPLLALALLALGPIFYKKLKR